MDARRLPRPLFALALASLAACMDPVSVRLLEPAFDPDDPAWVSPGGACGASSPALPLSAARRDSLPPSAT